MDERNKPLDRVILRGQAMLSSLRVKGQAMLSKLRPMGQAMLSKLRAVHESANGRKILAASGVVLALLMVFAMAGITGSTPEEEEATLVLTGKNLFEAIMEKQPTLRLSSRIAAATERGSSPNLMVLPATIWEELEQHQRNSLGAWLNTLGRRWEIKVGALSEDRSRVLNPKPVITSLQWNRQVK